LTVAGAISARAKYLLRKIETPRRKTPARKAAKAELFSARLWASAKNLRRGFRKVAPGHHTLSSFVTRYANARNIVPVSLWSGRRIGKRGSRPQAHRLIRRRRRL